MALPLRKNRTQSSQKLVSDFLKPSGALSRAGGLIGLGCLVSAQLHANPTLVWSDEFDGGVFDTTKWDVQTGTGSQFGLFGWGNNELQYYTGREQNLRVDDGKLVMTAQRENYAGRAYTSARIRTAGTFAFTYGRIEARIKLPKGQGYWPAFWLLPENSAYGFWPYSGEIDVMEAVNQMDELHGTIHFGGASHQFRSHSTTVGDLSDGYRVYTVDWEPDSITWSVDGVVYGVASSSQWWSEGASGNNRAPFDKPFHILLNVAVGGTWPGSPDGSTVFPQSMLVDWVRVYRQEQAPYSGIPAAIPGVIQAEAFDLGYPGEAYSDNDPGNTGGQYRQTDVDIQQSGSGHNVGWIEPGEWLAYSVRVEEAGAYDVAARVASGLAAGGAFRLERNGEVLAEFAVPSTGGWQSWQDVTMPISLPAGDAEIRVVSTSTSLQGFNFDSINFAYVGPSCVGTGVDIAEPVGVLNQMDLEAWVDRVQSRKKP